MKNNTETAKCVSSLVRRRRGLRFWRTFIAAGSVTTALAGGGAAVLAQTDPELTLSEIMVPAILLFSGCWVLAFLAGAASTFLMRVDEVALAKRLDDCYGTRDQVASALDLADSGSEASCFICARAEKLVEGRDVSKVFPFRTPRAAWLGVLGVALFALALVLTAGRTVQAFEKPPEIDELAKKLERFVEKREKTSLSDKEKEVLKKLKKLAEELKKKKISKKQALEAVSTLKKSLGKDAKQFKFKGMDLRKIAEALSRSKDTKPAAKQFEKRDVKRAADKLSELSDEVKFGKALKTNPEFEKLSEAFREASEHMGPFRKMSEDVSRSARFLKRGETSEGLKNLSKSMKQNAEAMELSDMLGDSMKELENLQQGLGNIKQFSKNNRRGQNFMKGDQRAGAG